MTLEDSILAMRLHVMRRAQKLGDVSAPAGRRGSPGRSCPGGRSASSATVRRGCIRGRGQVWRGEHRNLRDRL